MHRSSTVGQTVYKTGVFTPLCGAWQPSAFLSAQVLVVSGGCGSVGGVRIVAQCIAQRAPQPAGDLARNAPDRPRHTLKHGGCCRALPLHQLRLCAQLHLCDAVVVGVVEREPTLGDDRDTKQVLHPEKPLAEEGGVDHAVFDPEGNANGAVGLVLRYSQLKLSLAAPSQLSPDNVLASNQLGLAPQLLLPRVVHRLVVLPSQTCNCELCCEVTVLRREGDGVSRVGVVPPQQIHNVVESGGDTRLGMGRRQGLREHQKLPAFTLARHTTKP
mmetsp:Transcript_51318/g.120422  ORF Transcript_51318/g.120422 Transcript_51318/m.120422 type:complete len:272 (-) Transcript_51318:760-1575(-)